MSNMNKEKANNYKNLSLYIKAESLVEVTEPKVNLGTLMQMECKDKQVLSQLKSSVLIRFQDQEYRRTVVSLLKIVEQIHEHFPDLQIVNLGAVDIVVAYEEQKTPGKVMHIVKAVVISTVAFVGSAYSIMAFSNDVDTLNIFDLVYQLIVGTSPTGVTVLEYSYSLGLIVGILVFFNHFGHKKMTADPTPMEIEMRLYEQDIQTTLVQNFSRKGEEIDVGDSGIVNHSRG